MKTLLRICLFFAVIFGIFWFLQAPSLKPLPQPASQTAAPLAPPAQAHSPSAPAAPTPVAEAPPPGSVQELCANLAAQLQSGDFATIIDKYSDPATSVVPVLRQGFEDTLTLSSDAAGRIALWVRVLQALPDLTPTLSDNDETATYNVASLTGGDPESPLSRLVLKKRDGKWYFTVTSLLIGNATFGVGWTPQPPSPPPPPPR